MSDPVDPIILGPPPIKPENLPATTTTTSNLPAYIPLPPMPPGAAPVPAPPMPRIPPDMDRAYLWAKCYQEYCFLTCMAQWPGGVEGGLLFLNTMISRFGITETRDLIEYAITCVCPPIGIVPFTQPTSCPTPQPKPEPKPEPKKPETLTCDAPLPPAKEYGT